MCVKGDRIKCEDNLKPGRQPAPKQNMDEWITRKYLECFWCTFEHGKTKGFESKCNTEVITEQPQRRVRSVMKHCSKS